MRQHKHLNTWNAIKAKRSCALKLQEDRWNEFLGLSKLKSLFDKTSNQRTRIYDSWKTLLIFLGQVLDNDRSCQNAIISSRLGKVTHLPKDVSSNTAAYCKARRRLSENQLQTAAESLGKSIHHRASKSWMWRGRSVKLVDGTTVSMPDTIENQQEYRQISAQKPGLGFPIARVLAIISLATGSILNLAIGCYRTSEYTLLKSLLPFLEPGDIVLGDCHFDSYFEIAWLMQKNIDVVVRMRNKRILYALGQSGIVRLFKPARPPRIDKEEFAKVPDSLVLRIVWKNKLAILTTLIDDTKYSDTEIASLYRERWKIEVDFRSIKSVMQMDILRCKTPEMIRKEIWIYALAYNLIRWVMVSTAMHRGCNPRCISFKATLQALHALGPFESSIRLKTKRIFYETVSQIIVGSRPYRREPRAIKRRPKNHDLLMIPRWIAREKLNRVGLS